MRAALRALGFENTDNTDKWSLKRLNKKMSSAESFASLLNAARKEVDGTEQELLQSIAEALGAGNEVEVVADASYGCEGSENDAVEDCDGKESSVQTKKKGKKMATATTTRKQKVGVKGLKKGPGETRGSSLLHAAIQVMKGRKRPMKVKEVWELIKEKGLWNERKGVTPWATLGAAMYTEVKKKSKYSRFAKGEERGTFVYKGDTTEE